MPLKQHPTDPDMVIYTKTEYGNISVGKPWVGLTDEEVVMLGYQSNGNECDAIRLAEAKLKEKNGG